MGIYASKNAITMKKQIRIPLDIMIINVWKYAKENILVVTNAATTVINVKIQPRTAKLLYQLSCRIVVMRINLNVQKKTLPFVRYNVKRLKVVGIDVLRNVHTIVPMGGVLCLFQRYYLVVDIR